MIGFNHHASGAVQQFHHGFRNAAEVGKISDAAVLCLNPKSGTAGAVVGGSDCRNPESGQDFGPDRIQKRCRALKHQAVSGCLAHKHRRRNPLHTDLQPFHMVGVRVCNQHGIDAVEALSVLCQRVFQHGCADSEVNQNGFSIQLQKDAVAC